MDGLLEFLYQRAYEGRQSDVGGSGPASQGSTGGQGPSQLTVPDWLGQVRDLFPQSVSETITGHALDRFGMSELVSDPETLARLEPDYDLLKAVLAFRGMMQGPVLEVARRVVRTVVEDLRERLASAVRRSLSGRADRNARSRFKQARNLHLQRTLKASLKHYDPAQRRLQAADLHFFSRLSRQVPWQIIIAIDCSGSMMDSVIHAAVMAGIFHALPAISVKLVAFDTAIVDLSDQVDDPVDVLMSVQLGGGTDIAGAVAYCEGLVDQPSRTILVLVTDFFEGGSENMLLASIKRLAGAGVTVWGLAALDATARPHYDQRLAGRCADAGATVAALTPERLGEWVAGVVRS
jgi:Mg-chelatase subunit ChlD